MASSSSRADRFFTSRDRIVEDDRDPPTPAAEEGDPRLIDGEDPAFLAAQEEWDERDPDYDDEYWSLRPHERARIDRYEEEEARREEWMEWASDPAYEEGIAQYIALLREERRLNRKDTARFKGELPTEETTALVKHINAERHALHLRLTALAEQHGGSPHDVTIDVLRSHRSLELYGLPEFSILARRDLFDMNDDHGLAATDVFLVFGYSSFNNSSQSPYDQDRVYSPDGRERLRRAQALAAAVEGAFVHDIETTTFHTQSTEYFGLVIDQERLEEVAAVIRDNPTLYRLGSKYYKKA